MNPFQIEAKCDICGGRGFATLEGSANRWFGGRLVHNDPDECRAYLQAERQKITAAIRAGEEQR